MFNWKNREFCEILDKNLFTVNMWILGFCDNSLRLSREKFESLQDLCILSCRGKLIGPEGICVFFANGLFLKSLGAFAEFQRARMARTITLRLQIRPWFIAPLFAPLIFRKALLVAFQRVVTNYSIDAPIFQMRSLRTFSHRHLRADLV